MVVTLLRPAELHGLRPTQVDDQATTPSLRRACPVPGWGHSHGSPLRHVMLLQLILNEVCLGLQGVLPQPDGLHIVSCFRLNCRLNLKVRDIIVLQGL